MPVKSNESYIIFLDSFDGTYEICRSVSNQDGMKIATGIVAEGIRDEKIARLFSNAPELLDACERALQYIEEGPEFGHIRMPGHNTGHDNVGMIRAAIAKAKGEDGKG